MTARFIRVQGQARFTRKWPFETRVIRQKGVTYCRRHRVPRAIFCRRSLPFYRLLHPHIITEAFFWSTERYARKYEHVPFQSHVSRDLLIPQTLTRTTDTQFPADCLHTLLNYRPFSDATCILCIFIIITF